MRHEDIQRIYRNHYYISHRGKGGARSLKGKIDVLVFFVSDSESNWTDHTRAKYKEDQKAAMQRLLQSARSHGVNLQLRNAYIDTTVYMNCTPENYDSWSKLIMKKYGKPTIPEFQRYYKAAKQCDEAPIIFVLNKPFRSRAVTLDFDSTTRGEMSLLSSEYNQYAIIHELLHQFGAVDLYYPQEVHNLIKSMRYDSIMAVANSMHIDSLSAYLIGWTNWLDASAVKILDKTKHLTRDDIIKAINREYGRA